MTHDEAVKALDSLDGGDSEGIHVKADDIVEQYLRDNGAAEIADAFTRAALRCGGFWYA